MGLQGCDGGSSFLCLIIQKHDLCGRIENNVEAFRYTVLIHISRMTSATSARASRINLPERSVSANPVVRADINVIELSGGVVDIGREMLFHADGGAAATDVAGEGEEFL